MNTITRLYEAFLNILANDVATNKRGLKRWYKDFVHNSIIHPQLPFRFTDSANRVHDKNADWAFGQARYDEVGIENAMTKQFVQPLSLGRNNVLINDFITLLENQSDRLLAELLNEDAALHTPSKNSAETCTLWLRRAQVWLAKQRFESPNGQLEALQHVQKTMYELDYCAMDDDAVKHLELNSYEFGVAFVVEYITRPSYSVS
jgi:hypothetical protein